MSTAAQQRTTDRDARGDESVPLGSVANPRRIRWSALAEHAVRQMPAR